MKTALIIKTQLVNFFTYFLSGKALFPVLLGLVSEYLFDDFHYLPFLGIALLINTVMGAWVAVRSKKFSMTTLVTDFVVKTALYGFCLVLLHLLTRIQINGESVSWLSWLTVPFLFAMVVKEAWSAFENIEKIRPGFVPAFIKDKLAAFAESGQSSDLEHD